MKTIYYQFLKMALAIAIIATCGLQRMQAQEVTATIEGTSQTFAADALNIGNLASATAITVTGEWTDTQVLNLQMALKRNWVDENMTENTTLTSVDMGGMTFNGPINSGSEYLFSKCAALSSVILPTAEITNSVSFRQTFSYCVQLATIANLNNFKFISDLAYAFYKCEALKGITLPELGSNATSVSLNNAFYSCTVLAIIENLHKFKSIADFSYAFSDCAALTTITLPESGSNATSLSFNRTFNGCKLLTAIENLDKFKSISGFDYTFSNCAALTTITLPELGSDATSLSFNNTFSGCKLLTTIENLDKFTNISTLEKTFFDCAALTEVVLNSDLNNIDNNRLYNTFNGTNEACIKYLATGVTDIPQIWKNAKYGNFALPFTVTQEMVAPAAIPSGEALVLPAVPLITPTYAAKKDVVWQIKKSGEAEEWSTYTDGEALDISYNNAKLRCALTSYCATSGTSYSNEVEVTVTTNCIVTAIIGGVSKTFYGDDLTIGDLEEATNITLTGKWTNEQMLNLQKALKKTWTEENKIINVKLKSVDMSKITLVGDFTTGTKRLFMYYAVLTSVTLPERKSSNSIALNHTFHACSQLKNINNLDKLSNISDLSEAFVSCGKLTQITLPNGTNATNIPFFKTFYSCTELETIVNLDKFTNISDLNQTFTNSPKLTNITLPEGTSASEISFYFAFYECHGLTSIINFDKFNNINNLSSTFRNCYKLSEVRLGTDPNNITSNNLANTFNSTNEACIKYLPTGVDDIPDKWKTAGYGNFALPFDVAGTITTPEPIFAGEALIVPAAPGITPTYAAAKVVWQIQKSGEMTWSTYTAGDALNLSYNNAKLRCTLTDYCAAPVTNYSNEVMLTVNNPYQDGDGTEGNPYQINSVAGLKCFAIETTAVYGKLIADVTIDSDASFNAASTLTVDAGKVLTLATATFALPNMVMLEGAEIDGANATVTSITSLTVCKDVNNNKWNAIALPFVPTSVTLINSSGEEKAGTFIGNGFPKKDSEYTSMSYDGQARYENGINDPIGTNNWRYKNPADNEIGEIFAFGDYVNGVMFTATPSDAMTIITEKGSNAALTYHNEVSGQDDSHRGWNTKSGMTTRSMSANSLGDGPVNVQYYNRENNSYLVQTINGTGSTFKPFTPLFVQATADAQNIQFGDSYTTRSASMGESLYCLELHTEAGELLDRLYVGVDLDTRLYNVGKMGAMGKAAVLAAKMNGETLCSAVAQRNDDVAKVQATIYTAGRSGVRLVWTNGGNHRLWLNGTELHQGEAIAAVDGNYTLTIGATPTGLEYVSASANVYGTHGTVVMEGIQAGSHYVVYNTTGTAVAEAVATTNRVELSLPAGIYVVNIDRQAYKVTVR